MTGSMHMLSETYACLGRRVAAPHYLNLGPATMGWSDWSAGHSRMSTLLLLLLVLTAPSELQSLQTRYLELVTTLF